MNQEVFRDKFTVDLPEFHYMMGDSISFTKVSMKEGEPESVVILRRNVDDKYYSCTFPEEMPAEGQYTFIEVFQKQEVKTIYI
jgi:hypothetical protein